MIKAISPKNLGVLASRFTFVSCKRYVHAPVTLNWEDPLDAASLFTEEELAIQETASTYCQERMLPRVLGTRIRLYDIITSRH